MYKWQYHTASFEFGTVPGNAMDGLLCVNFIVPDQGICQQTLMTSPVIIPLTQVIPRRYLVTWPPSRSPCQFFWSQAKISEFVGPGQPGQGQLVLLARSTGLAGGACRTKGEHAGNLPRKKAKRTGKIQDLGQKKLDDQQAQKRG